MSAKTQSPRSLVFGYSHIWPLLRVICDAFQDGHFRPEVLLNDTTEFLINGWTDTPSGKTVLTSVLAPTPHRAERVDADWIVNFVGGNYRCAG